MHISSLTRPKLKEKKKIGSYGKQLIQTEQKPQWMFKRANHINLESLLLTKLVKVTQAILPDPKKPSLAHVSIFERQTNWNFLFLLLFWNSCLKSTLYIKLHNHVRFNWNYVCNISNPPFLHTAYQKWHLEWIRAIDSGDEIP